ncbi:MAG: exodeoxyribonuclease V subunit gamma [Chlamydiae bacterium]|nr:exodeoxyribonuclease V subunit gamma [Chlamydiota bacterium]
MCSQVYFSNSTDVLIDFLVENLYSNSSPFLKRIIVIPDFTLKKILFQKITEKKAIAAGISVWNLAQTLSHHNKDKKFLSHLQLSFSLQQEIEKILNQKKKKIFTPLTKYLSRKNRIGPLCDNLSRVFLHYTIHGKKTLKHWLKEEGWKQELWKIVLGDQELCKENENCYHFFGFSHLPSFYLHFFKELGAKFYSFSPCRVFWEDFYSEKEKIFIQKSLEKQKVSFAKTEAFTSYLQDQNPLLANWGKIGRKRAQDFELETVEIKEKYLQKEGKTILHSMQNDILNGTITKIRYDFDETTCLIAATSPLREIEILYDELLSKKISLHEVLILAPDIEKYIPFIHAVFGAKNSQIPYAIFGVKLKRQNSLATAFLHFLSLPKNRFSKDAILDLFSFSEWREKFQISESEFATIKYWIEKTNIRWGIDSQYVREKSGLNKEFNSFEKGIDRLFSGLIFQKPVLDLVRLNEIDLFDKWIQLFFHLKEDLAPLENGTEMTISSWLKYLVSLLENYFSFEENDLFFKSVKKEAKSLDSLNEVKIPFERVERIIEKVADSATANFQENQLHAVKFASIREGWIFPQDLIYLVGMEEEKFPRPEQRNSLFDESFEKKSSFFPTQADLDHYLFLSLFLSAKNFFYVSYSTISHEDQKPLEPAPIVQELFSFIKTHYGLDCKKSPSLTLPFAIDPVSIPDLFNIKINSIEIASSVIEIKKIKSLMKHPLRFFLKEVLGLSLDSDHDHTEFTLSPLLKYKLLKDGRKKPFEEVWSLAEKRGQLPIGVFTQVAKKTIEEEIEKRKESLKKLDLSEEELFTIELNSLCSRTEWIEKNHLLLPSLKVFVEEKEVEIIGEIDQVSKKGMAIFEKKDFVNQLAIWPIYLIYLRLCSLFPHLSPHLLFLDDSFQNPENVEQGLIDYLSYYQLSCHHPSPLLQDWAEPLLKGDEEIFIETFEKTQIERDEILHFLFSKKKKPSPSAIFQNWSPILRKYFKTVRF